MARIDDETLAHLREVATLALEIAAFAPVRSGGAARAGIPWPLIEQLRAELDAMGVKWLDVKYPPLRARKL
jgi:hypothetical protein